MHFRNMRIRRKLMVIILVTCVTALLLMSGTFFAYEYVTLRRATVRQLTTLGEITAANSTAALAFENQKDANEILAALAAERHVVAACLYDRNGRLFARYPESLPDASLPPGPGADGYRFARSYLEGFQPVTQGGNWRFGTLYLRFDTGTVVSAW